MNNILRYGDEAICPPYHYTECGLDDIYLISGYVVEETPYGPGVTVKDVDQLHRVIGENLAKHKKLLTGKEIRFLRKQMDLTQSELGKLLGVSDQAVARYEKGENNIPGAADGLLRALFLESIGDELSLRALLSALEEYDAPLHEKQLFAEEDGEWRPKLAA